MKNSTFITANFTKVQVFTVFIFRYRRIFLLLLGFFFSGFACAQQKFAYPLKLRDKFPVDLKTGAERTEKYFPLLKGKSVAVVAHPASVVQTALPVSDNVKKIHPTVHLVDTLLSAGIKVKKIFAPEHGFRGEEEAGKAVKNLTDAKTKIPVVSLYGNTYKPTPEQLKDVQVVLFDLQDVGARFYTYVSTLHYVMEACAENKKQVIVLDRPNPNGHYVDGPVLEEKQKSFSGMHPVPVVHGMTMGEYAQMLNGEKWLKNGIQCMLTVIPVENYTHEDLYQLPIPPSPNLPNMSSAYLYPSLCFFEGTAVSVGRGTSKPFQQFGYPGMKGGNVFFTPVPIKGVSENPPYNGQLCEGFDVSGYGEAYVKYFRQIYLFWLINVYKQYPVQEKFFNSYFNNLAGNEVLKKQITEGATEEQIVQSWQEDLKKFKTIRKKYLLYKDFE